MVQHMKAHFGLRLLRAALTTLECISNTKMKSKMNLAWVKGDRENCFRNP